MVTCIAFIFEASMLTPASVILSVNELSVNEHLLWTLIYNGNTQELFFFFHLDNYSLIANLSLIVTLLRFLNMFDRLIKIFCLKFN